MALWTDLVEPRELTVFARRAQADVEAAEGSLSNFFPSTLTDGDTVKYTITESGLVQTAEYRAWDTETGIGKLEGGQRVALELPPLGRKIRIGEFDHIRDRNDETNQMRIAARATATAVKAVTERLEVARADALNSGRIQIEENGFNVDVDLGRDEDLTVSAATAWDTDGSDPIQDILAWVETYTEMNNGEVPGTIMGSRKILSVLQRNAVINSAVGDNTLVTLSSINSLLGSYGLPSITTFDRRANVGGTVRRLLPEENLFLLPAAGSNALGQTVFGRTAEADDPEYGLAIAEAPGVVAALHREWDPFGYWTHVTGIGLPVMTNPNASMVATVTTVAP